MFPYKSADIYWTYALRKDTSCTTITIKDDSIVFASCLPPPPRVHGRQRLGNSPPHPGPKRVVESTLLLAQGFHLLKALMRAPSKASIHSTQVLPSLYLSLLLSRQVLIWSVWCSSPLAPFCSQIHGEIGSSLSSGQTTCEYLWWHTLTDRARHSIYGFRHLHNM